MLKWWQNFVDFWRFSYPKCVRNPFLLLFFGYFSVSTSFPILILADEEEADDDEDDSSRGSGKKTKRKQSRKVRKAAAIVYLESPEQKMSKRLDALVPEGLHSFVILGNFLC